MRTVFADTGFWIALWNPSDQLHRRALAISDELSSVLILTTQAVLFETLNYFRAMGGFRRRVVAQMVLDLEANPGVEIIHQTAAHFQAAIERYAARPDQRWSLTDCASFLVMEERGIGEALAYDRDFEQAGFVALLRDASL